MIKGDELRGKKYQVIKQLVDVALCLRVISSSKRTFKEKFVPDNPSSSHTKRTITCGKQEWMTTWDIEKSRFDKTTSAARILSIVDNQIPSLLHCVGWKKVYENRSKWTLNTARADVEKAATGSWRLKVSLQIRPPTYSLLTMLICQYVGYVVV
jgi:hypothetical protein